MDFAKQMSLLLWLLACGAPATPKSLAAPPPPTSTAEVLEFPFPFDTASSASNETAVEPYDEDVEQQQQQRQNLETNSIQTTVSHDDDDDDDNKEPEGEDGEGGGGRRRPFRRTFLSNDSIVCNDGSSAGSVFLHPSYIPPKRYYIRKSQTESSVWIVFLEGGWYCYDQQSCWSRWARLRHLMTSTQWPETREENGILSEKPSENPFWYSANHVIIPYCSSDTWSGTSSLDNSKDTFHFMGKLIVLQVIRDLVPLGLENSTQLIFAGSSAGGTGVMINLDPVQHLLHADLNLKHIAVRGISDSGWFLDRTPFSPTALPAVDAIKKGYALWQGSLPKRCVDLYREEPWRCYFGYRLYPTLRAPLFIFQWLFDEAQMTADNVGAPVTPQQWDYIHQMGNALRSSFQDVPALFAPSCVSHSILTKREWLRVSIEDVTVAEAIRCWELSTMKKSAKFANNVWNGGGGGNKSARKLLKSGDGRHSIINGSTHTNAVNKNNTERIAQMSNGKNHRIQNHRRRRKKPKGGSAEVSQSQQMKRRERNNHQRTWHSNPSTGNNVMTKHPRRPQNQRRRNNLQRDNSKNKKRKQGRRKTKSGHACSKDNDVRATPANRRNDNGQLKCQNVAGKNIRRHVHNRNRSATKHLRQLLTFREGSKEEGSPHTNNAYAERQMRLQRSLRKGTKSACEHRHIERCSWPQCNHSCPRLMDPFTGEEIPFIEMLKSFGFEMENVAQAFGVDVQTLNNMEPAELLNLLTQQSN